MKGPHFPQLPSSAGPVAHPWLLGGSTHCPGSSSDAQGCPSRQPSWPITAALHWSHSAFHTTQDISVS